MWIISIDGGGTKCEAGLFTVQGELVASAKTGPANLYANFAGAIQSIEQCCDTLLRNYQVQHKRVILKRDCFLSVGCAGGGVDSIKRQFKQWQHDFGGAALNTDVYAACLAANEGQSCALFVIGTGSCLAIFDSEACRDDNIGASVKHIGGHGFLLGDNASGAWLGKKAVSWYLQALETPNDENQLFSLLASELGSDTSQIIERYGHAPARDFGALAPSILSLQNTSGMVDVWLDEGAHYAANLLSRHRPSSIPIFLTGGLANVYKPLIGDLLQETIYLPSQNAVYGGFLMGKKCLNIATS